MYYRARKDKYKHRLLAERSIFDLSLLLALIVCAWVHCVSRTETTHRKAVRDFPNYLSIHQLKNNNTLLKTAVKL